MRDATVRDIEADYIQAYLAEFESYKARGHLESAERVAAVLRAMGHDVPPGAKERAVDTTKERAVDTAKECAVDVPHDRAVEGDAAPKRRGRPRKTD